MTTLLWLLSRRSAGLAVMLRRELSEARRIVPPVALVAITAMAAHAQNYCIAPGACGPTQPWRPSRAPQTYAQPAADRGGYDARGMDATLAGRLKAIEDRVPAGTDKLAREEHIRLLMEHITAGEKADQSRDAAIRSAHDRVASLEQATRENRDNLAAVAGAIGNTADAQSLQNMAEWEQRQDNAIAKNIQAIQAIQQTPTPTPAAIAESVARSDSLLAVVRDHTREVVKEAAPVAGSAAVHWALAALGIAGGGGAGGLAGWLALRGVRRLLNRRDDGEDTAANPDGAPQSEARTHSAAATVLPADDTAAPKWRPDVAAIRQARDDAEAALKQCREARLTLEKENERQRQQIAGLDAQLAEAAQARASEPTATHAGATLGWSDGGAQPKPQQNQYIRVPGDDDWGWAYQEAIARYAKANPSRAAACATIESVAKQLYDGRQASRRREDGWRNEQEIVP